MSVTKQDFSQNKKQKYSKNGRRSIEEHQPIVIEQPTVDPNELLYCTCRRVYFGRMVGCENNDCKYEWFHFECVGITEDPDPDISWYCPECSVQMNEGEVLQTAAEISNAPLNEMEVVAAVAATTAGDGNADK